MSDEKDMEEQNQQTQSPREIIDKHKFQNNQMHNAHNPNSTNAGLERALKKKQIKSGISTAAQAAGIPTPITEGVMDTPAGDDLIEEASSEPTVASGIAHVVSSLATKKWLALIVASAGLFFFIFLIAIVFLLKNSDGLNYASGSYLDSEEYRKIYETVEKVVNEYKSKYGVTVDKYLIISALTAYQGNEMYVDTTDSSAYDNIDVETDDVDQFNKSVTEMENYAEILAKYQIKTVTSCSYDSSTMRKIASNDDDNNIFNFWTSAAAKEKNYDCSGGSSDKSYSVSNEEGNIDDDNSGSVFYWNLVDENFLNEYYSEYFSGISDELYEETAAETIEYIYLYAETLETYDTTNTTVTACNGTSFWWPIGSSETTTNNSKTLASGEPVATTITATFAGNDNVHKGAHGALDIATGGDVNIIAAKAGTVVYPTSESQINYPVGSLESSDGGGYGNYVIIEHSDGTFTLYAHMRAGTITVMKGESVAQGQVIGKMGSSGRSTGQHLHFEVRIGGNSSSNKVDPEKYVSMDDPRPGCGDFSLTSTSLSKQEFVTLMNAYCSSSGDGNFCTNFSANAEEVYDVSLNNNVNPELVVVTAGTEQGWKKCDGLYNFWGIGIPNGAGCSAGPNLTSLEAGIKKYAETINNYLEGGSQAAAITSRYNARLNAGCDPSGYGPPGTLAGMQSVYSWIGDHRYNPGSWGKGGCIYLNIIYGSGYCSGVSTCTDYSNCPESSRTTTCEQSDYTAFQLKGKVELRQKIFGL